MDKLFYPAVFHVAEEGGFWVTFPDFPECLTQGENLDDAYRMAADALSLSISSRMQEHAKLPAATKPQQLTAAPDEIPVVIEFDLRAYQKRASSRSVKKTLSIPEWLNEEAMARNLNFSQILQEALIARIQTK